MTTHVHVVNFGPNTVEVKTAGSKHTVYPQGGVTVALWKGGPILVEEVEREVPVPTPPERTGG